LTLAEAEQENAMGEPLTNLIQLYRIEHETLIAHQRELERRRTAVRAAAEREASEIVVNARRDIRGVLLRARQQLKAVSAQVRAAGCEAASVESGQPDDFNQSAARDVRTMLRDARSELASVSKEASSDTWAADPAHEEGDSPVHDSSEQAPATFLVEQFTAHWQIALVALVVLTVVATMFVALRPSGTEGAEPTSRSGSAISTSQESVSKAAATDLADLNPTATRGSDARPLKPAAASGIAAARKPDAPPATTTTPSASAATAERAILDRHQQWFDAFNRGDRATMASLASDTFSMADERPERAVSSRVAPTIRDVHVRVTGIGAVLSGQIAETTAGGDAVTVALLSEVWIRRGEQWQIVSVRMAPVDAVAKSLQ
jgi:predicted metal-dependent hydrolase